MQDSQAKHPSGDGQEPRLMTVKEVAKRLHVSTKLVRKLEKRGLLMSRRFGRVVRFDPDEVQAAGRHR